MGAPQHTPGPWRFDADFDHVEMVVDGGAVIARIMRPDDFPCRDEDGDEALAAECAANVRLIAAAPDMLAAFQRMRDLIREFGTASDVCRRCDQIAEAVLAKVEARS